MGIGRSKGGTPGRVQFQRQDRLVDLHRFDAGKLQTLQQLLIAGQHLGQQIQLVRNARLDLALIQQRQRTDQRYFYAMAERTCFCNLIMQPVDAAIELHISAPFRHQIVIVGIEPLCHFHREVMLAAARQGEIVGQRQLFRIKAEAAWNRAQQSQRAQYLVVPGKVADGHEIKAGIGLGLPVTGTQRGAGGAQYRCIGSALPERLLGKLQFAVSADARKP